MKKMCGSIYRATVDFVVLVVVVSVVGVVVGELGEEDEVSNLKVTFFSVTVHSPENLVFALRVASSDDSGEERHISSVAFETKVTLPSCVFPPFVKEDEVTLNVLISPLLWRLSVWDESVR